MSTEEQVYKDLLISYFKFEINKQELIEKTRSLNIPTEKFNNYILSILRNSINHEKKLTNVSEVKKSVYSDYSINALNLGKMLTDSYMKNVQECLKSRVKGNEELNTGVESSHDNQIAISGDCSFLTPYYRSKMINPSIISYRLKKICAGFNMQVTDYSNCLNFGVPDLLSDICIYFVKNVVDACRNAAGAVDEDLLIQKLRKTFPSIDYLHDYDDIIQENCD
ncbi:hypothetical protein EDEG_03368 [Edhazardia aedis USNM 41457]|uniref:Uncharacterized protein n=1 Tax=Edhazardia aedis (strain USNM 41457) TaxID=1003232 RepID=J9DLF5_EDHAE|nr:hypothetical protein EDEG_03368 [Edhazardia aedis USNM 41457]|eukprot:EJW02192.1 hypothetical protein EDEG_03368 [Edhazardia aedis USNM 41457]